MKKLLGILVVGLMLCATGCGDSGKKLKCNTSLMGMDVDVEFKYDKDGKVIQGLDLTYVYTDEFVSAVGAGMDEFYEAAKTEACSEFAFDGVKCSVSKNKNGVAVELKIADYGKLSQDAIDTFGFGEADITIEELKESSTGSGFTCK